MAITFNAPEDRFGLQQAGSILAEALLQKAKNSNLNNRQNQQNQFLTKQLNQQNQFQVDKESRQNDLTNKSNSILGELIGQYDIQTPQGQIDFIGEISKKGGNVDLAFDLIKEQNSNIANQMRFDPANRKAPVSDLRKNLNKDIASTIRSASQIESSARDLDRLQELSQQLTGPFGYAEGLIGTEPAAEFDALGLSTLAAPLKIFNPVGAIPTQKIKLLQQKFAPKSTDLQGKIEGKIAALRRINQAAASKVQKLQDLVDQYGSLDAIPDAELLRYSNESEKEIDKLIAEPLSGEVKKNKSQKETFEKLPTAKNYKPGQKIKDEDTGKVYISDGSKWTLQR